MKSTFVGFHLRPPPPQTLHTGPLNSKNLDFSPVIMRCIHSDQCAVLNKILYFFQTPSCRQSACHWSRPYRQSPTRIQQSKSANCESARQVESFWKDVSWAAVSSRSSSTLWPPRDTPSKSLNSSPPSLVEM